MGNHLTSGAISDQMSAGLTEQKMEEVTNRKESDPEVSSGCMKEKLDNLIEGYLLSGELNSEADDKKTPKEKQPNTTEKILLDNTNSIFQGMQKKTPEEIASEMTNNGHLDLNAEKCEEKSGTEYSSKHENSGNKSSESSKMTSFESMIEKALNDSMKAVDDTSNVKTHILELCEDNCSKKSGPDLKKVDNDNVSTSDKNNDDMSMSKKNVMYLKDHIERVLERNFPSSSNKKNEEENKVKQKGTSSTGKLGLTLEEHMQKLIDEHLSKENMLETGNSVTSRGNDPVLQKKTEESSSVIKDNMCNAGIEKSKCNSAFTNKMPPVSAEINSKHSVETVVDRIIKNAVNESFTVSKPSTDQWRKNLRDEIYSDCDSNSLKKMLTEYDEPKLQEGPQNDDNFLKGHEIKSHHQKLSGYKAQLQGKEFHGNREISNTSHPVQKAYYNQQYLKQNMHPSQLKHVQDSNYHPLPSNNLKDINFPPYSHPKGCRCPLCERQSLINSGPQMLKHRMDSSPNSTNITHQQMHELQMGNRPQYTMHELTRGSVKPPYTHQNRSGKPTEESYINPGLTSVLAPNTAMPPAVAPGPNPTISSAMAPGPSPPQKFFHQNSQFRMPQLYPSNPPIPSPREYFNSIPVSKLEHLQVPSSSYPVRKSRSPIVSRSSPNNHPVLSPRYTRQPSPTMRASPSARGESIKSNWQKSDSSPVHRKPGSPGLDLSVKPPSAIDEQPLDLSCKKAEKMQPSHPELYNAYPLHFNDRQDLSESVHINHLQNSVDKFCQPTRSSEAVMNSRLSQTNSEGHCDPHYENSSNQIYHNSPYPQQTANIQNFHVNQSNSSSEKHFDRNISHTARPQQQIPRMHQLNTRPPFTPHQQESPESPTDHGVKRSSNVSKHEPIQNIIGNHSPSDILYLICRLCNQTYGSPYGFRKHFRNQHGFEPRAEHTIVQTISATKALQTPQVGHYDLQGFAQIQQAGMTPQIPPSMKHFQEVIAARDYFAPTHSPKTFDKMNREKELSSNIHNLNNASRSVDPAVHHRPKTDLPADNMTDEMNSVKKDETFPEKNESNPKYLECHECGQTFQLNDFGSYKRHCRQHGNKMDPFTCNSVSENSSPVQSAPPSVEKFPFQKKTGSLCSSINSDLIPPEENFDRSDMVELFTCKYCNLNVMSSDILEEHINTVHTNKNKKFICILCNGKFHLYHQFKIHMKTSHQLTAPDSSEFKCPETSIEKEEKVLLKKGKNGDMEKIPVTGSVNEMDNSYRAIPISQITKMSADNAVTSASPDSSSDPINCSEVQSTTTVKISDTGKSETSTQAVSRQTSYDSESDKSNDFSEMKYLHKKFKRKLMSSSDNTEIKRLKPGPSEAITEVNSPSANSSIDSDSNSVQNAEESENTPNDTKISKSNKKFSRIDDGVDNTQSEARHHLPFVWDRITRSQAVKGVKASK